MKPNEEAIGCEYCDNNFDVNERTKMCIHKDAKKFKKYHRGLVIGCPGYERSGKVDIGGGRDGKRELEL